MERVLGAILGGVMGGLFDALVILLLLWGYNARRNTVMGKVLAVAVAVWAAAVGYVLITSARKQGMLGMLSSQIALLTIVWAVRARCRKAGWVV